MLRFRAALAAGALATAVVALNAPTWDYGFVYDDKAVILQREPAWEQGWGQFLSSRPWGTGRHAVVLSFDLNRDDPLTAKPFHVANTLLAAAAPMLLFGIARALGIATGAAFAGALLFAVHPVHVDAVVSIVGRAELLAGVSVLGCLLLHARGHPLALLSIPASGLLFFTGAASKENALVLPLLALAYDGLLGPSGPWPRRRFAAYAAYAVAGTAWAALVARHLGSLPPFDFVDNPLAYAPTHERIPLAAAVLWRYLGTVVAPLRLRPDRAFADTDPSVAEGVLASAAWLLVLAACWRARRTYPRAVFCTLWFLIAFAVTSNVVHPIGQIMAERLVYLPSAGVALLAALAIERAAAHGRLGRAATGAVVAIAVVVLAFAYDARARVWTSEPHYHLVAVIESPKSAKAHYNLGIERSSAGDWEAAEAALRRALEISPRFPLAAYYLASVLQRRQRPEEAAEVYEAYLALAPEDKGALSQLLSLQLDLGRHREANATAKRLVALDPANADHLALLAVTEATLRSSARSGQPADASP